MSVSTDKKVAPYGTWESPITADTLFDAIGLRVCATAAFTKGIFHTELRPADNGRTVLRYTSPRDLKPVDIIPANVSCGTAIHEYGGGAFASYPDELAAVYATAVGGVYKVSIDDGDDGVTVSPPKTLVTESDAKFRYGNFAVHPKDSSWILSIKEYHPDDKPSNVVNTLVVLHEDSDEVKITTIAEGKDFYTSPSWSPDGTKVTWLQWSFPDMPWTGTEICLADWVDGSVENVQIIAGKAGSVSTGQPRWGPDGNLYYYSDETAFWQLYKYEIGGCSSRIALQGLDKVEFAYPEWRLGDHSYDFLTPTTIVASYVKQAVSNTILIDTTDNTYRDLGLPFIDTTSTSIHALSDSDFTIIASTLSEPSALYICNINDTDTTHKKILSSTDNEIPKDLISNAEHITFPRLSSSDPSTKAYAWYYAPRNPDYEAPEGTLPPLIISLHGGPTSNSTSGLSPAIQYWTSRGYAYAFVNYAGSTGYGRRYQDTLNLQWGVADVDDAADCVYYLSEKLLIDQDKVGTTGGSAGGYGVLQAICKYPRIWAGVVSYYGISNLKKLVEHTHKFESRYPDGLLWGPNASPEDKERIMEERSPLYHAQEIKAPVLLLQGSKDEVVPPEQAEEMERVIKNNGGTAELIIFQGEGHGFEKKENLITALNNQEKWWRQYVVGA